jgi:Uma2 family endonuclease
MQSAIPEVQTNLRPTIELAELWPPQGQWTEADYFALPDTNRYIELSEGEFIMPPHPTETHQRICRFLFRRLDDFVETNDLGTVRYAPLPVRLWPDKIREPDILFVSQAHAGRIGEQFYGPPDLVVEVTSPGTWRTDRRDKYVEYAQAGIEEYWLVDPEARTIEVFVLEEGVYVLLDKSGAGQTARSRLLEGFQVAVDRVMAG